MTAAVFLDRDNTLIHNDGDLGDPRHVHLIQGAASAVSSLCGLGYRVLVVSNQGGVARGQYSEQDVQAVNERIRQLVQEASNGARIDGFYYCPYHPEGTVPSYTQDHETRKPAPGMLLQAAEDFDLDLAQSWMIGDQMRDIEAGAAAGTRTVLLADPAEAPAPDRHAGQPAPGEEARPNFVARNLVEAVRVIAQQRKPEPGDEVHRHKGTTAKRWDAEAIAQIQRAPTPEATAAAGLEPGRETTGPASSEAGPQPAPEPAASPDAAPASAAGEPAESPTAAPAETAERPPQPEPAPAPQAARATATGTETSTASREPAEAATAEPAPTGKQGEPVGSEKLLRAILQELRAQRAVGDGFSPLTVIGIVLQMIAGLCLVGALLMGAGDDSLFLRWIAAGLIFQNATIAILLFHHTTTR